MDKFVQAVANWTIKRVVILREWVRLRGWVGGLYWQERVCYFDQAGVLYRERVFVTWARVLSPSTAFMALTSFCARSKRSIRKYNCTNSACCSMFTPRCTSLTASFKLSSCMYKIAATNCTVVLQEAMLSLSHSCICSIAISLRDASAMTLANNLMACNEIGVLLPSLISLKIMWCCPNARYERYTYSSFSVVKWDGKRFNPFVSLIANYWQYVQRKKNQKKWIKWSETFVVCLTLLPESCRAKKDSARCTIHRVHSCWEEGGEGKMVRKKKDGNLGKSSKSGAVSPTHLPSLG